MSDTKPIPLLLFAKAPVAGKVKTRLQTHCSAEQAAAIAEKLLRASLEQVCAHWPGEVCVSTWLDFEHPVLLEICAEYGVSVLKQCEGDLGQKMRHAFDRHGYPLAIMGSDAPHIGLQTLAEVHRRLSDGECVIGPSEDGGYYIIGLSQAADFLFNNMPWGQPQVLGLTRKVAKRNGLVLTQLEVLQDIDEWPDLLAALPQLPELQKYLASQRLI